MPRPAWNQRVGDSPRSSTGSNESGLPHGRRTRASHRNAVKNSNMRVFQTRTDGRISNGDRTVPHIDHDPALTAGRLAELCSECECYLRPEETDANRREATSTARRNRCDDCYRRSPAPIAPIGGPTHSFGTSSRYVTVPQTVRERREEELSERREEALPEGLSAGITGGGDCRRGRRRRALTTPLSPPVTPALSSSGNACSRLSRNSCALLSGHAT